MKSLFLLYITLIGSFVLSIHYIELDMNVPTILNNQNKEISFYKLSLNKLGNIPSQIEIKSELLNSNSKHTPIIGIYYEPFKKMNYKNSLKSELGKIMVIKTEFIKSALERNGEIYIGIYGKNCQYRLEILPKGDIKKETNFVQIPQMRNLIGEEILQADNNKTSYNETDRLNYYSGNGLCDLFVAFLMIFVSLIGCGIMMNVYVHNTALVEQPLKLGKIEG